MSDNIQITKHSEKRSRKRLGINKKGVERDAEKALIYGVSHREAKGRLSTYMDGVFLRSFRPTNLRVYNHYTYLFRNTTLLTVLPLPKNLWPQADKLQKRKKDAAQTGPET